MWDLLLSRRHHAASVSCMTACFPRAALLSLHTDDDVEPASEMMHARLERPEDVSGSRESVQHARYCWLSRDSFNVSTCQAAICHTLSSQSIIRLDSPDGITYSMIRADNTAWPHRKFGALGRSANNLNARLSIWNKVLNVLLLIFYSSCLWASTLCWFQVKPQQQRKNPCQCAAPKCSLAEQMPIVVLWAVMN